MRPKHTNPNKNRTDRIAHAPYNFVALPNNIVTVEKPISLDEYSGFTGWFDCTLETSTPTYVRGMLSLEDYERIDKVIDNKNSSEEQKEKAKKEKAPFYSTNLNDKIDNQPRPSIPGSSIKGMLRSLIEVLSYGKMRWVNDSPAITFRAVAASKEDPLAEPYRDFIGSFSRNVKAGYLHKNNEKGNWEIKPAKKPMDQRWPEQAAFLKVKERLIPPGSISNFKGFNDKTYKPGTFAVYFSVKTGTSRRGQYVQIDKIIDKDKGDKIVDRNKHYPYKGVLVCSGNMLETARQGQSSPRRNHALLLEEDKNAYSLKISDTVVENFLNSLTPFEKDNVEYLWDGKGNLKEGTPVFYVASLQEVVWFGHTPNFRIPAMDGRKLITPLNFVPEHIRNNEEPDMAETLFGWVEEKGNLKDAHAGRVQVTDANFAEAKDKVWLTQELIPKILASPKITTFQHYLVQDTSKGHDPNSLGTLAHYSSNKNTTEIRGYKFYWHRGEFKVEKIQADSEEQKKKSQLTYITPVNSGVKFTFRVYFENLREAELGALAWALQLPAKTGKEYRHKLGMGKPLGMGAVKISANLHLTDRKKRYSSFFNDGKLVLGEHLEDTQSFVKAFENLILQKSGEQSLLTMSKIKELADLDRVKSLLAMLEWGRNDTEWFETTKYQTIEPKNEYKNRPVLPDPVGVIDVWQSKFPLTTRHVTQQTQPRQQDKPINVNQQNQQSVTTKTFPLQPQQPKPQTTNVTVPKAEYKNNYRSDNKPAYTSETKNYLEKSQSSFNKPTNQVESNKDYKTGTVENPKGSPSPYGYVVPDGETKRILIKELSKTINRLIGNRVYFKIRKNKNGLEEAYDVKPIS